MRAVNRLTATAIRSISERGLYGDGHGLSLQVSAFGTKAWIFRYQRGGTPRMMGLGPVNTSSVAAARKSLSGARERAQDAQELLLKDIDPIDARRKRQQEAKIEAARILSFKACAERYIKAHRAGWKNAVHAEQWPATLETYVYPVMGNLPVSKVDTGLVIKCIEGIWETKNGDSEPHSRPYRVGAGLGEGPRTPRWRQPSPVERAPQKPPACSPKIEA